MLIVGVFPGLGFSLIGAVTITMLGLKMYHDYMD